MKSAIKNTPEYVSLSISNLGKVFKLARKVIAKMPNRLSQVEVAKKAGCLQQDIAEFEGGNRNATLKKLFVLLNIMGIELYIKDQEGEMHKVSEKQKPK